MALYNFHRVLIGAAILFDLVFSLYCFRKWQETGATSQLIMLIGSSVVTVAMVAYLIYFNKNLTVLRSVLDSRRTTQRHFTGPASRS